MCCTPGKAPPLFQLMYSSTHPCPKTVTVPSRMGNTTAVWSQTKSLPPVDARWDWWTRHSMECYAQPAQPEKLTLFLRHHRASCLAQQRADAEHPVHWSQHLLAGQSWIPALAGGRYTSPGVQPCQPCSHGADVIDPLGAAGAQHTPPPSGVQPPRNTPP